MSENSQPNEKDQQIILAYVYGELSDEQRQQFEQRMATDSPFRAQVARQQQLDQLIKPGTSPDISLQRANAVHWTLHKKLAKAAAQRGSLFSKLSPDQISLRVQLMGMALTFALGFMFAQSPLLNPGVNETGIKETVARRALALDLIGNDDYQIVDLELVRLDPASGLVNVNYSLASRTELSGHIASKEMLNLLALTMKNDVSDAIRLEIVEIFRDFTQATQVRDALSYSLLNDPNPGVRMAAAESLATHSSDKSVRQVLRQALEQDINAGIRVAAFEGLMKHLDDKATLETFKQFSFNDSNQYIRHRARLLFEQQTVKNSPI